MRAFTLFFICILLATPLFSQELKFGEVTLEELQETESPIDKGAHAAYLYKYRNSYYRYYGQNGLQIITQVHERIKIYDAEGLDYATKEIRAYKSGGDREKVTDIKGATYNLVDGKIVEEKMKGDATFKEEVTDNFNLIKLTLPGVREGSVIEYRYTLTSPFFTSIDDYIFQEDIPVKHAIGILNVPSWFNYNQVQRGYLSLTTHSEESRNHNLDVNERKTTFVARDLPGLVEEPYVSNMDNYRLSMNFEIISIQVPGQVFKVFSKTWPDVVSTIYSSQSFGGELKKGGYYQADLESVLSGVTDPVEKMYRIFTLVKSKVRWNEHNGKYCELGVREAYKEGSGNTGDINLMLVSMLRAAGIQSQPVLLTTRNNVIPLYPSINGFDYVIALGVVDGNYYLMDATDPFSVPNILPIRTLNWIGRAVNDDGSSQTVSLMPQTKATHTTMINAVVSESGEIEGDCSSRYTGHYAYMRRRNYASGTEQSYLERLESERGKIEISDYEIANQLELTQPLNEKYKFYMEGGLERISDKLYLNPMLFLVTSENPFKSEKREFNVELGYPFQDRYLVNIQIPEGYTVEFMPEQTIFSLPDNQGTFQYNLSTLNGKIVLQCKVELTSSVFSPDFYPYLKEFFNQVVIKNKEKIVLVKA